MRKHKNRYHNNASSGHDNPHSRPNQYVVKHLLPMYVVEAKAGRLDRPSAAAALMRQNDTQAGGILQQNILFATESRGPENFDRQTHSCNSTRTSS